MHSTTQPEVIQMDDVEMTPEQAAAFDQAMEILSAAGFDWEMVNDNVWQVTLD